MYKKPQSMALAQETSGNDVPSLRALWRCLIVECLFTATGGFLDLDLFALRGLQEIAAATFARAAQHLPLGILDQDHEILQGLLVMRERQWFGHLWRPVQVPSASTNRIEARFTISHQRFELRSFQNISKRSGRESSQGSTKRCSYCWLTVIAV